MKTLKELRLKHNMSQFELASKIGMALSTISNWESGNNKPSRLAIKKLDKVFGKDCFYVESTM